MARKEMMNPVTRGGKFKKIQWALYVMLIPGVVLTAIYSYGPLMGLGIAFQKYNLAKGLFGSPWVGLRHFHYIFSLPDFGRALRNTLYLSSIKIVLGLLIPIIVAILLNELRNMKYKRTLQTMIYLPHFISWVILAGVFREMLSPSFGVVNKMITSLGFESVFFLGDKNLFPIVMIVTDVWKNFGFGTILYLAALAGVDPALYEAASIDGANRWHRIRYITLPSLTAIIVLNATLSLGGVLNAGFDQIVNLYSPAVYSTSDIIDTLVYRIGLDTSPSIMPQYDVATAVGLFKSAVSAVLVSVTYFLAHKFADYKIF